LAGLVEQTQRRSTAEACAKAWQGSVWSKENGVDTHATEAIRFSAALILRNMARCSAGKHLIAYEVLPPDAPFPPTFAEACFPADACLSPFSRGLCATAPPVGQDRLLEAAVSNTQLSSVLASCLATLNGSSG
jgi:hypothetical protein